MCTYRIAALIAGFLWSATTVAQQSIPPSKHFTEPIKREGDCYSHSEEFKGKGTWACEQATVSSTGVGGTFLERVTKAVESFNNDHHVGDVKTIIEGVGSDPDCDSGKARCEVILIYLPKGAAIKDVRYFWLARNGDDSGRWLTSPPEYDAAWGRVQTARYQEPSDGRGIVSSVCVNWSGDQQFRCALGVLYSK